MQFGSALGRPDCPPQVHGLLARSLLEVGRSAEARDLAESLAPDHPAYQAARVIAATAAERMGDTPGAIEHLKRLVAEQPQMGNAWCDLVRLGALEDPAPLEALLAPKGSRDEQARLHMSLAKVHDRNGNHGRAFEHATRGNQLRPNRFDAVSHQALVEAVCQTTADGAPLASPWNQEARPVFIVGAPRTGTSLLERMLDMHPELEGHGERSTAFDLARRLGDYAEGPFPAGVLTLDSSGASRFASDYLAGLGSLRPIDKAPGNLMFVGMLARVFPHAVFLHCRRDPRDVALSMFFTDFGDEGVSASQSIHSIAAYLSSAEHLADHWRNHPNVRWCDVNYESMVSSPEDTLRPVFEALELPFDPVCLDFVRSRRVCRTASSEQVRQPLYRRSVGRWKSYAPWLGPVLQLSPPAG